MSWEIKRVDDPNGNVCKFVYTKDDAVVESVLYKYPTYEERTVICCSTQSGCPVGCRFCGTGNYFVRSLTSEEIVEQVDYSLEQTGVDPLKIERLQIMFMSMGEPLLNVHNLCEAIRVLHGKYPKAALLISTSAPKVCLDKIVEISQEVPTVGLQFSVHESTDEARDLLIPFKEKLTLKEIAAAGMKWCREVGRKPFFNYCAGPNNTSDEDADRIRDLFDPAIWECTVSVICESNDGMPASNSYQEELAQEFSAKMLDRGFNVRVFNPDGQDSIGGGCGQLWFVQDWMKNNPEKSRPSVGYGLPVVHCPN